jgi:hypothetical protein
VRLYHIYIFLGNCLPAPLISDDGQIQIVVVAFGIFILIILQHFQHVVIHCLILLNRLQIRLSSIISLLLLALSGCASFGLRILDDELAPAVEISIPRVLLDHDDLPVGIECEVGLLESRILVLEGLSILPFLQLLLPFDSLFLQV